MDINQIMDLIPHRYPFLFVDRITELEPGVRSVGIKNVSAGEPYFSGHFPGKPVMPGVIMIESMAQVGACALLSLEKYQGAMAYLAGVDRIRFRRQVLPGDVLLISTELIKVKGGVGKARGKITCEGQIVCSGEFLFAISTGEAVSEDYV